MPHDISSILPPLLSKWRAKEPMFHQFHRLRAAVRAPFVKWDLWQQSWVLKIQGKVQVCLIIEAQYFTNAPPPSQSPQKDSQRICLKGIP
jgi:hypothetical protein